MREARAQDVIAKALQSALAGDGTVNNVPQTMLAERVLTALSSAGIDCEGWRDIESAPKDGKPILLWKESTQEHYVAAWVHGAHGPGWCTPDGFQIFRATHWRPLPLPPLASGGG